MAKSNTCDGPGEKLTQFSPGSAGSLPTKHYPSSTKMGTGGKGNTVEGPCSDKGKYTK